MSALAVTFCATLAVFTLIWVASLRLRDAGIVDLYWGPGFALVGWLAMIWTGRLDFVSLSFLGCLTLWALRLGWHMTARHEGIEDPRYRAMRERHGDAFPSRSLWMVFWLQAVIQWLASSPALVMAVAERRPAGWLFALGVLLFAAGFALEAAADRAIRRFRADPSNSGKLLMTGLHGRVRHPNYLGEIVLQWGFGLMALDASGNPTALFGPALMTFLIAKISGVPLLEEHFAAREGFAEWKARTGALWPRFG